MDIKYTYILKYILKYIFVPNTINIEIYIYI